MERLGGYDASVQSLKTVALLNVGFAIEALLDHRGEDGIKREKPETERNEMVAFVQPLKADIVEV